MKKTAIKYFHIRIRLILVLIGAAAVFLGFLEFALSKNILTIFIGGFGYSAVLIGISALHPHYSLLKKIFKSFFILLYITIINWFFVLFLPPAPSNTFWFIMLSLVPVAVAIATVIVLSLPTTLQNLLKLLAFKNIRSLIISFLVVYVSFIFFFALCYATIYKFIPDSFESSQSLSFFDITYYSVVTITTLGYGDIRALHWVSRLLSMIEVIVGLGLVVIYVGITAAILLREKERRT